MSPPNKSKSIKIVHVIAGLGDGGAEGVLTRLCLNSSKAAHVVISLTDEGKYGPVLRENGVTVYSLGMNPGMPRLGRFFRLMRHIRSEKPDVVQTWMYHADLLGGLAARLAGVPNIFWGIRQSTLEKGRSKRLTAMIARLCAVLSYIVPEKIICCANKVKEVHGELGYCKSKLTVIPNGYDLSKFKPSEDARNWVREQLGVSRGEILLGMVGRYHPQKNHRNLLEALSLLIEWGHSFRCVLVGTDMSTDNHPLLEEIIKLGLAESILLAGPRTDIPELMNALDVHVLSSSTEGFPNVVAESMACGTPCVSTDVGAAAEIIADTGTVCLPESPEALAQSILILLDEQIERPELWSNRKRRARERIAGLYSLERTIGMFESAWHLTE